MTVLAWEEPITSPRERMSALRDELRQNPGRWAKVDVASKNRITNYYSALPRPEFEVTVRSQGDGTHAVYARFVGEGAQ